MSKRNFISVKLIDDSGDEFDSCDNCIHSDDSEEIFVLRKCTHVINELHDCFKRENTEKVALEMRDTTAEEIESISQPTDINFHSEERKQGFWIPAGNMIPRCPFCDAYSDDADRGIFFGEGKEMVDASYCPNCGANLKFKN